MENKSTAIRKRQQIAKANRTMFLWVAVASIIVGFSAVVGLFLFQKIVFGEKVLAEQAKTEKILTDDLNAVSTLSGNVRALETDDSLKSTRLNDNDRAVQSVLDALPADANSTALGSSLQTKLLSGINGVTLDAIKVEPVLGVETDAESSSDAGENTINFTFSVSVATNNPTALKQVLQRLEKSIRAINVTELTVEQQGSRLVMSAVGHAYYQPAKTIQLKDKAVRP